MGVHFDEHLLLLIVSGLLGLFLIILLVIFCLVFNRRLIWKPQNYEAIHQVSLEGSGLGGKSSLISEVQTLKRELAEEQAEKERALKRLSSIMSSRFRDGNPNIVDLNDPDRPAKLGEQYSELYDNQWTDAYHAMEKIEHFSPENIIEILLHILLECFEMCKVEADMQMVKIRHDLETIVCIVAKDSKTVVDDILVRIKEERKLFAAGQTPDYQTVKQMLLNAGVAYKATLDIESVQMFTQECARLCWLMVVQDPPMELLVRPNGNAGECFRPYLTSGKHLLYVVWPTLILHKKGTIVFKGIAEFGNN